MLTAERLKELLDYEAASGTFRWKSRSAICLTPGNVAGRTTSNGYVQIKIDYVGHLAHRLAWLYVHGSWPSGQIDHINGDRTDNRIANLREATSSLNGLNRLPQNHLNKHGLAGVIAKRGRFQARIIVNRRQTYLGIFDTPEQAHACFLGAKEALLNGQAQWLALQSQEIQAERAAA